MRIQRWILGISLRERMQHEEIRRAGVVKISEKIKMRLRCNVHIMRGEEGGAVKRS